MTYPRGGRTDVRRERGREREREREREGERERERERKRERKKERESGQGGRGKGGTHPVGLAIATTSGKKHRDDVSTYRVQKTRRLF
jgi:hypothetical protein